MPRRLSPEHRLEPDALLRVVARIIVVGALFLALGCMHWTGEPLDAALGRRATLRLRLRDGSSVIVREAVVQADSIVGVPWGSAPRGSRIAVARTQVERVDVGEADELRTTGLVVGIVAIVLGACAWLAVAPYHDPS